MVAQSHRGEIAGAARGVVLHPNMDEALKKGAGREDNCRRLEDLTDLGFNAAHGAVLDDQALDAGLAHLQVGGAFEHPLAAGSISGLVGLRASSANGRAFARVEKAELNSSFVGRQAHLAAERVDLADQVSLADAADRGIARHLAYMVEVECEHQGVRAHPGGGQCSFNTGVTGADNDDVVVHFEMRLWSARDFRAKHHYPSISRNILLLA